MTCLVPPQTALLDFIKSTFAKVNDLLGRWSVKYLTGSSITLADVAFAAVSSPMILPEECGSM